MKGLFKGFWRFCRFLFWLRWVIPRNLKRECGTRKESLTGGLSNMGGCLSASFFVFNNLRAVLLGFGDFLYFCGWRWPG